MPEFDIGEGARGDGGLRSVDALGGKGRLPQFLQLDGAVAGNMGLDQLKEANLIGVQSWVLLDEVLEVLIDLGGVHADDVADGEGKALRLVWVVLQQVGKMEIGILEEDVGNEFLQVGFGIAGKEDRFAEAGAVSIVDPISIRLRMIACRSHD